MVCYWRNTTITWQATKENLQLHPNILVPMLSLIQYCARYPSKAEDLSFASTRWQQQISTGPVCQCFCCCWCGLECQYLCSYITSTKTVALQICHVKLDWSWYTRVISKLDYCNSVQVGVRNIATTPKISLLNHRSTVLKNENQMT